MLSGQLINAVLMDDADSLHAVLAQQYIRFLPREIIALSKTIKVKGSFSFPQILLSLLS
jgi:hypothetical protein